MPAALKSILTASLILLALAMPRPCPAQDSENPENALPQFVRCTQRNDGQIWLHEPLPAGTQIDLLPLNGSERITTTVPENARYIYYSEVVGPYDMTLLPLETNPDIGLIPMAVLPPGLPSEDLQLNPVPEGQDPLPQATQALPAHLSQRRSDHYDNTNYIPTSHLHLTQDGVSLDVLVYSACIGHPYYFQYVTVSTPTTFQAFPLGCHHEVYKLFRLDGVLYLMTQYLCCECGNEYITINAFQDGEFVTVYINGDWGN